MARPGRGADIVLVPMGENAISRAIAERGVAVGAMLFEFDTPGIMRILAAAGVDFALFDLEHTGWDAGTLRARARRRAWHRRLPDRTRDPGRVRPDRERARRRSPRHHGADGRVGAGRRAAGGLREVPAARPARVRGAHERRPARRRGRARRAVEPREPGHRPDRVAARDRERRRDRRGAGRRPRVAGPVRPDARDGHPRPVRPSGLPGSGRAAGRGLPATRKAARTADRDRRRGRGAARAGLRGARLRRRVGVRARPARAGRRAARSRAAVVPADPLGLAALAELFNEGFSDYLLPMRLDEAALRDHVRTTTSTCGLSRGGRDRPAAFACSACGGRMPGSAGWRRSRSTAAAAWASA